jgi:cysteine desulfuration protein SufE
MTIQEKLDNLKELFSVFEDRTDQFIQLMDMAKGSGVLSNSEKIDKNKIYGCTSQAWIVSKKNDNQTYTFQTDSDAMIVKGLLTLLEDIFNGQKAIDICSYDSQLILKEIGLEDTISSQRTNGFSNAVEKIKVIIE